MLELFRMAQAQRTERFKDKSLVEIFEEAAKEAGWHQVLVPNLQNRNKLQVRYERPFSSEATAEIICRARGVILKALAGRDIDPKTIDSHIGWGVLCFIKTYNPEKQKTDSDIYNCIYIAVQRKVQQSMRKEEFKYRPGYVGATEKEKELAEKEGRSPKGRYTTVPKSISINTPISNKDGDDESELEDFIPSPDDFVLDLENEETERELIDEYSTNRYQKFFMEILMEMANGGRVSRTKVVESAIRNPDFTNELISDLSKSRGCQPGDIPESEIEIVVKDQVRIFYKGLKKKLSIKLDI